MRGCQLMQLWLSHRYRGQAPSHILISIHQVGLRLALALALALALLLILISRAPSNTLAERRLESVGNPAGRRVSRAGPRMAHRGGPRFNAGERACRAEARHRVVGQEPFGYFGAFPK